MSCAQLSVVDMGKLVRATEAVERMAKNYNWAHNEYLRKDTKQVKRHVHPLRPDHILQNILFLVIRRATFVERTDSSSRALRERWCRHIFTSESNNRLGKEP